MLVDEFYARYYYHDRLTRRELPLSQSIGAWSIRSFVYEGSVNVDISFVGQLADPGKRAPS
jgi:hypothetical protein